MTRSLLWACVHRKGRGGFVLLVVRRSAAGRISVLSHKTHTFGKITVEDVRLFSDGQGKIRALYNRWRGGGAKEGRRLLVC